MSNLLRKIVRSSAENCTRPQTVGAVAPAPEQIIRVEARTIRGIGTAVRLSRAIIFPAGKLIPTLGVFIRDDGEVVRVPYMLLPHAGVLFPRPGELLPRSGEVIPRDGENGCVVSDVTPDT